MPNTAVNTIQSAPLERTPPQFMRRLSAPNALGFAQVMQAFSADADTREALSARSDVPGVKNDSSFDDSNGVADQEESTATQESDAAQKQAGSSQGESASDSDDALSEEAAHTKQDVNQEANQDAGGQGASSSADGVSQERQPSGQSSGVGSDQDGTPKDLSAQALDVSTIKSGQPTQGEEASLRLLKNQSDQAKLSIKGVERTLTHAADIDLASIASNITLGRADERVVGQQDQQQAKQGPQQGPPTGQQDQQSAAIPKGTPPNPTLTAQASANQQALIRAQALVDPQIQYQSLPVESNPDQSASAVQQARSRRGEAVIAGADTQTKVQTKAQSQTQSAIQAGINPLASSLNAVAQGPRPVNGVGAGRSGQASSARALTGVEAMGLADSQSTQGQSGALVEKMSQPQLPNEALRANVMAQVQRGLASLLRSGRNEMTLKLTPGHLGDIKIRVKTDGNRLMVGFETTSDEATELLNASVKDLTASLRTKGLNLDQVHVQQADASLSGDEPGAFGSSGSDQESQEQKNGHHQNQGSSQSRGEHDESSILDLNEPGQASGSIWTQLGLDAIA